MIYDLRAMPEQFWALFNDSQVLQPEIYRTDAYGEITAARRALDAARERELQGVDTSRAAADQESARLADEIQKMKTSHKGEWA